MCHSVHNAPAGGIVLLPSATIYGTCFTCHDGTGGWGVYGAIAARGGTVSDTSRHGILLSDGTWSSTNVVPGGSPTDGGDLAGSFSGAGGVLMCNDCHSPHDADTVNPFVGDRARIRQPASFYSSSKLLKRLPTGAGATTPVDDYGSGWCLTCHAGRSSGGLVHNHPAQTAEFTYSLVSRLVSNDPTGLTEMGPLGGLSNPPGHTDATVGADNRGFLMPWPRTPQQAGRAPICQQCHEDTRSVGTLDATGAIGDAAPAVITYADGVMWNGMAWETAPPGTVNPTFQNFPHETENPNMLVETNDDLCLNCHPATALP